MPCPALSNIYSGVCPRGPRFRCTKERRGSRQCGKQPLLGRFQAANEGVHILLGGVVGEADPQSAVLLGLGQLEGGEDMAGLAPVAGGAGGACTQLLLHWASKLKPSCLIKSTFLLEPSYTSRSFSFKFASALLIVLIEHPSFSAISFRLMRLFSFTSSIIFSLILFWGSPWGSFLDSFFFKNPDKSEFPPSQPVCHHP